MAQKKKALRLIFLFLIAILSDALCTFVGTPDLSREGNPLVTVFGLGWGALFIANIIVFFAYCYLVYYAFVRYERSVVRVEGAWPYYSTLLYKQPFPFSWHRLLFAIPKNWKPVFAAAGYAAPVFIIARAILVAEWLCIILRADGLPLWYGRLRAFLPLGRTDIWVALPLYLAVMIWWFFKEYRSNKAALLAEGASGS